MHVDVDVVVDVDDAVDDNTALLELGSTCSILASACNATIMMMKAHNCGFYEEIMIMMIDTSCRILVVMVNFLTFLNWCFY